MQQGAREQGGHVLLVVTDNILPGNGKAVLYTLCRKHESDHVLALHHKVAIILTVITARGNVVNVSEGIGIDRHRFGFRQQHGARRHLAVVGARVDDALHLVAPREAARLAVELAGRPLQTLDVGGGELVRGQQGADPGSQGDIRRLEGALYADFNQTKYFYAIVIW